MTTKDFIKLALIAAGYVKNISIEAERTAFGEWIYSCYGERWGFEDDGTDSNVDDGDDSISITEYSVLEVLDEIMQHAHKGEYIKLGLNMLPQTILLNDEEREKIIREHHEAIIRAEKESEIMSPAEEAVRLNKPCLKAPNCLGDFDDSDTCHGFWKCTHQYHMDCPLLLKWHEDVTDIMLAYRKKHIEGKELTEEENNILNKFNL